MNKWIMHALAHPVFDPERQIGPGNGWREGLLSFVLTVNIGME
jgi:hypothetical protein